MTHNLYILLITFAGIGLLIPAKDFIKMLINYIKG